MNNYEPYLHVYHPMRTRLCYGKYLVRRRYENGKVIIGEQAIKVKPYEVVSIPLIRNNSGDAVAHIFDVVRHIKQPDKKYLLTYREQGDYLALVPLQTVSFMNTKKEQEIHTLGIEKNEITVVKEDNAYLSRNLPNYGIEDFRKCLPDNCYEIADNNVIQVESD